MLLHRYLLLICLVFSALFGYAQNGEQLTLHAVTLRIDTVQTSEQAQEIKAILNEALAIRDYDAKLGQGSSTLKVNFTFLDAPAQHDIARQRLEAAGYAVSDIGGVRQQTLTVFEDNTQHRKKEPTTFHAADLDEDGEVTEAEYIEWMNTTGQAQPEPSGVKYHPADTNRNGDVTEEEYKTYLKTQED